MTSHGPTNLQIPVNIQDRCDSLNKLLGKRSIPPSYISPKSKLLRKEHRPPPDETAVITQKFTKHDASEEDLNRTVDYHFNLESVSKVKESLSYKNIASEEDIIKFANPSKSNSNCNCDGTEECCNPVQDGDEDISPEFEYSDTQALDEAVSELAQNTWHKLMKLFINLHIRLRVTKGEKVKHCRVSRVSYTSPIEKSGCNRLTTFWFT